VDELGDLGGDRDARRRSVQALHGLFDDVIVRG
jgi:hypothetical protein